MTNNILRLYKITEEKDIVEKNKVKINNNRNQLQKNKIWEKNKRNKITINKNNIEVKKILKVKKGRRAKRNQGKVSHLNLAEILKPGEF